MAAINPYLNFLGKTEEAFNFYKSIFKTEFSIFQRFSDSDHGANLPESDKDKIMHVSLPIGNSNILMGTDALESAGHSITMGNNISLSVTAESKEEADTLFNGLSTDGKIDMPLEDTFWGAYFGMCTDKFGIQWMVNYDYPQN